MRLDPGSRVAVALSGGVDSTAAAIILKQRGFDVLALTMLLPSFGNDTEPEARSVRELANAIGVELELVDVRNDFERLVIRPFLDAYLEGSTPNPCVTCNREIKFKILLNEAIDRDCSCLASGHYARLAAENDHCRLLRGADALKDQSYVLWTLDQETLGRLCFPLGKLSKQEAWKIVKDAHAGELVRPESQDICFLSGNSLPEFLSGRESSSIRPGPIINLGGQVLGTHKGLPFYTVGQRRGLGISSHQAFYVVDIRPETNTLVVGDKEHRASSEFQVGELNFISGRPFESKLSCKVMTRYRGPTQHAQVEIFDEGNAIVRYREKGPPAAPGQSAVFYHEDELLGGGIIKRAP